MRSVGEDRQVLRRPPDDDDGELVDDDVSAIIDRFNDANENSVVGDRIWNESFEYWLNG